MRRLCIIAVFTAFFTLLVSPAGGGIALVCTLTGTAGNDNLVGTQGDDVICGLGGNDVLTGLKGNDFLDGGPGRDVFLGGKGNDSIYGDTGLDIAGFYDSGIMSVNANLTTGTAVTDVAGTDSFIGSTVEDLYGSPGNDTLTGDAQNNYLYGRQGNDAIDGLDGDDIVVGGDGSDAPLNGGNGNDAIQPGDGSDTMNGGPNLAAGDTLKYNDATAGVNADISPNFFGAPATLGGAAAGDVGLGFENVTGSAFNDVLRALHPSFVSVVNGIGGADFIDVKDGGGGDTADGGPGSEIFCNTDIPIHVDFVLNCSP